MGEPARRAQRREPELNVPATLAPSPELLFALDIDGTIVDHDGHLMPVVARGIAAAQQRGAVVMLATGRGVGAVLPIAHTLNMTSGYAVCSNGALVVELNDSEAGFEVTDVITFDPEPIIRRWLELVPGALFMVDDAAGRTYATGVYPPGELAVQPPVVSVDEICQITASRVTLRAPEMGADELRAVVEESGMEGVNYAVGWTAWMDITPKDVSKGSALEMLRGRLQIARNATVAVGDGANDVEMLRWAHWSVAMGQARPEVQACADAVTNPVDEAGLAFVLSAVLTRKVRR